MSRPFRFGVTAMPVPALGSWPDLARRIEAAGYDVLFLPENHPLPDGLTSAGIALGATSTIEVGTFVIASPLHEPRHVAWQAHSLATTSGGRFRFGIGTGRPDVAGDAEALGVPFGTPGQRLARVAQTLDALTEADGAGPHTPVLVAAGGPRALALAAERADTVALALHPMTDPAALADLTAPLRHREITVGLFVIGDEVPAAAGRFVPVSGAELAAADSLVWLPADPDAAAEKLLERRERFGISCITIGANLLDAFAPIKERLAGR